jgi:hypothetical protein
VYSQARSGADVNLTQIVETRGQRLILKPSQLRAAIFWLMVHFKVEQLPPSLRRDVERYMETHRAVQPRLRPEIGMAQNVWIAFIEPKLRREGGIGVGKTPSGRPKGSTETSWRLFAKNRSDRLLGSALHCANSTNRDHKRP